MYLITGITGQDGVFLTRNILSKDSNAKIVGTSRSSKTKQFYKNLQYLDKNINVENIDLVKDDLLDSNKILELLRRYNPEKIINLSGPSSVYESLDSESKSYETIKIIFKNLSNACIESNNLPVFFQASSSEMFNQNTNIPLDENTQFSPSSPYAKAKHEIHMELDNLRKQYDWNINSGIMFNHESEFRNDEYLFMKIINSAIKIKNGDKHTVKLGSLDVIRDWSYASDFSEAIFRIVADDIGDDYIIGSGEGNSIKSLVENVFNYFDLNWELYITVDENLLRPGDPEKIISNPKKILDKLGWKTETSFEKLIEKCIKYQIQY
tara:strand:+ start:855 stop:1823 length:969 start_codon:yes stop_codon:yes gene_type:complete